MSANVSKSSTKSHAELVADALGHVTERSVRRLAEPLNELSERRGTLWICGNGGSQANAAHMVLHMRQVGIVAHDLSADIAWITALSNDDVFERAWSKTLLRLAREGDALFLISGSGDSPNLLQVARAARRRAMPVFGLLGMAGECLAKHLCQAHFTVGSSDYGIIEDVHSVFIHALKKELLTKDTL